MVEEYGDEVNYVMLEPREYLDNAIVNAVRDMKDSSCHLVYSERLLKHWYGLYFAHARLKKRKVKHITRTSLEKEYKDNFEEIDQEACEWVEYNTLRSMPYMGENRPLLAM